MGKHVLIVFGLPGVGKTYVSRILHDHFDYFFHDGDQELPQHMRDALEAEATITDDMRDDFFTRVINKAKALQNQYDKLVIAQTFIKEKYRKQLLESIPNATFLFVQADDGVRENRLQQRKEFQLSLEYARQMCRNFDEPKIAHQTILNNVDGEEEVKRQLNDLLSSRT